MGAQPLLTYNTALILQSLDRGLLYGFQIMEFTELPSGTVYSILRRLELAGWRSSDWERTDTAHEQGRPRRRYYALAEPGRQALVRARERFRFHQRVFGDLGALVAGTDDP